MNAFLKAFKHEQFGGDEKRGSVALVFGSGVSGEG